MAVVLNTGEVNMAFKAKDTDSGNELNFIGAGTYLEGNIETKGSLRIDGKVKGIVKSGDTLTVGSSGEIVGEVHVKNAIVGGRIEGNVNIEQKLVLESTSSLSGNLRASKLIIDEGAFFSGKSQMGNSSQKMKEMPLKGTDENPKLFSSEGVASGATQK
jgi:cytoskeletal protein CcmA (bactofilin family)